MTRVRPGVYLSILLIAFSFGSLAGCVTGPLPPENILETPELYVSNGFKLIKTGRYDDAESEFKKALKHDPRNSAAHGGLALAKAYKRDYDAALISMKKSEALARSGDEEYMVQVGWIRLYSVLQNEGWIKDAEKAYSWACSTSKHHPEAHYYMGIAYKHESRIDEARAAFLKVVDLGTSLVPEARNELRILRKMESAKPLSSIGRRLAVEERVTRAEMAALLFHELSVLDILKIQGPAKPRKPVPDLRGHPLRDSVEKVLNLDIKGLSVYGDGTFGPDEVVTRAGFSIMMADVISRAVDDPALISRHAEKGSPFTDVRGDAPYLGAVLVCAAWGGDMEPEPEVFNPMGALAGYDAVFFIQKIRGKLLNPQSAGQGSRS